MHRKFYSLALVGALIFSNVSFIPVYANELDSEITIESQDDNSEGAEIELTDIETNEEELVTIKDETCILSEENDESTQTSDNESEDNISSTEDNSAKLEEELNIEKNPKSEDPKEKEILKDSESEEECKHIDEDKDMVCDLCKASIEEEEDDDNKEKEIVNYVFNDDGTVTVYFSDDTEVIGVLSGDGQSVIVNEEAEVEVKVCKITIEITKHANHTDTVSERVVADDVLTTSFTNTYMAEFETETEDGIEKDDILNPTGLPIDDLNVIEAASLPDSISEDYNLTATIHEDGSVSVDVETAESEIAIKNGFEEVEYILPSEDELNDQKEKEKKTKILDLETPLSKETLPGEEELDPLDDAIKEEDVVTEDGYTEENSEEILGETSQEELTEELVEDVEISDSDTPEDEETIEIQTDIDNESRD